MPRFVKFRMKRYKSQKSKKGKWYSKGWQTETKALDTFNTKKVNIPIIDIKNKTIDILTLQMSEHIIPKACFQILSSLKISKASI